jgi:hypothetical protein
MPNREPQHWQDFESPVTLQTSQAGSIYRAVRSVSTTLRMIADHHLRSHSDGVQPLRLSPVEVEAMLAGALALSDMVEEVFEDLHV